MKISRQRQERAPERRLPAAWERRVQRVSLRTKIVVPIVVLAVAPALMVASVTILRVRDSLKQAAIQRIIFDTASKALAMNEFLLAVQDDLRFLSRLDAVRELATLEQTGAPGRLVVQRQEVEQAFLIFSQGRRAYYQVRYLNSVGREVVRLNRVDGRPEAVPEQLLQDKGQRYYIASASRLDPGQIYVSPLDLNVERGQVETPYRVVVRYATPVAGHQERGRGLLVINLYADHLLSLVGPLPSGTEAWLVDEDGIYVGYVGDSEGKRELYGLERRRPLATDFGPEDVSSLLQRGGERRTIEAPGGLLSHAPVHFDTSRPDRTWSLIVSHPRALIDIPIRRVTGFLSAGVALVVAVAGGLGVMLARYVARPVELLRQAAREIAGGDLTKRVEITTGDEIEELAVDFNEMTRRLREAQERLSGWNVELEREVSRRTDELRHLQQGLARADKLASVGQMTASVLHEIGNPLAAIKTRIQVAEEEGSLGVGCAAVLSEVLVEVDRLTVFLRSFSRLARLRAPQMADVALAEIVDSVVTLVGPELHRRGISLRVESAVQLPVIRGDANQLRQLLINLILNAAEASSSGDEVWVRAQRVPPPQAPAGAAAMARIEIADQGTGIPASMTDKIWDPFFTTKTEGTGLGLAICRTIVEDHDGTIRVESQPGEGTVVSLTFPPRPPHA